MTLDLNGAWTDADVAALLASVVDDRDWRLEIGKAGIAELQDKTSMPTGTDHDATLHGYFETWMQGTDFVGPGAASDTRLVARLAQALRDNYPTLKHGPSIFVDL